MLWGRNETDRRAHHREVVVVRGVFAVAGCLFPSRAGNADMGIRTPDIPCAA
jgi:hypothetical protein